MHYQSTDLHLTLLCPLCTYTECTLFPQINIPEKCSEAPRWHHMHTSTVVCLYPLFLDSLLLSELHLDISPTLLRSFSQPPPPLSSPLKCSYVLLEASHDNCISWWEKLENTFGLFSMLRSCQIMLNLTPQSQIHLIITFRRDEKLITDAVQLNPSSVALDRAKE